MIKKNSGEQQAFSDALEKTEFVEDALGKSLKGQAPSVEGETEPQKKAASLNFESSDPVEEGRLFHFLQQLAKLCHLRGDMIPRAQELLLQKFSLNRRDRHHLKQMSSAHAVRSEGALKDHNIKLALLERIKAWHRMPRDLSLLLDVTEAYIEPENFSEQQKAGFHQKSGFHRGEIPEEELESEELESEELESEEDEQKKRGSKRSKKSKERKKELRTRRRQEKAARQLFQLSAWQHRRQALSYLKKAVELRVGLGELEGEELLRLQRLQEHYPKVNWQRYTKRIEALKGRPRRKWPWILLILLFSGLLYLALAYIPWRTWSWWSVPQAETLESEENEISEQQLLEEPVPVEWDIASERDQNFAKAIQKSQRLKLAEFYAYEVQGQIRVKTENDSLLPAEPFQLHLNYEHRGKKYQKSIAFSYSADEDPNEVDRALVLKGDTVLFREVFRLPPDGPAADDVLQAKIAITGPAAPAEQVSDMALPSIALNGREIPQLQMGLRQKLERSDGAKVRMLGYDLYVKNKSQSPLDFLDLRLNWTEEDGVQAKEGSPVLLRRDYTLVSPSGSNLPGASTTTQRLWVEVPEDLNYDSEDWTPQVRILDFGYRE